MGNRLNNSFAWGKTKTKRGKFYNTVDFETNENRALLNRDRNFIRPALG